MTPSRAARFKGQRRMLCSACPRKWEFIVRSSAKREKGQAALKTGCSRNSEWMAAFVTHRNSGGHAFLFFKCALIMTELFGLCFSTLSLTHLSLSSIHIYFPQRSSVSSLWDPVGSAMIIQEGEWVPQALMLPHLKGYWPPCVDDFFLYPISYGPVLHLCVTYA